MPLVLLANELLTRAKHGLNGPRTEAIRVAIDKGARLISFYVEEWPSFQLQSVQR